MLREPGTRICRLRALLPDRLADLLRRSKDDRPAIALHPGPERYRLAGSRTVAARVGLEAQVEFPHFLALAVRGLDRIGVAAILDRAHLGRGGRLLQVWSLGRHAHHAAALCGLRRLVLLHHLEVSD